MNNIHRVELSTTGEHYARIWDGILIHNTRDGMNFLGPARRVNGAPDTFRLFTHPGERCYPPLMDFGPGHLIRGIFDRTPRVREFYAGVLPIKHLPKVNVSDRTRGGPHPTFCTQLGSELCFLFIPDGMNVNTGALMMLMFGLNKGDCLILT